MAERNIKIDKQKLLQLKKLNEICKNPVLWAKVFITTVNNNSIEIKELQMLLLENENNFLKEQNKILTQALLEKKKELC